MKLLYVIRDPPGFGGAERRLLEISKWLVAQGHTVHVLCGKTQPNLPDHEEIDGVHYHYVALLPHALFKFKRFSFYAGRYLFYFLSLFFGRYIRRFDPDIIIDYVTPSPSFIYPLARLHRIPCAGIIMEYRGYHQWREVADPISAHLGYIGQNILFHSFQYDQILTISTATHRQLVNGGIRPDRIKVIPLGVEEADHIPQEPVARKSNTLLVVGRLMPQKGHTYLHDAFHLVRQQIPTAQLWVIGEGPLRQQLTAYTREKGLSEAVTFAGNISEAEKITHLWQATLFAMPSLQEGFGAVLLEAMACELPIVAFDLPVYREWFNGATASFVPRLNTAAFAQAIIHLLKDEKARQNMAVHNKKCIAQYSWHTAAEMEEQCLQALYQKSSTK
jgi:glycosyltransferase involved in cell wall biosynthesis